MLLDAIWGEVVVSDSMPAICVGELRKALGDDVKAASFIETVRGRGYRFIAEVTESLPVTSADKAQYGNAKSGEQETPDGPKHYRRRNSQSSFSLSPILVATRSRTISLMASPKA
jgi:DNA-binding winged helix-turn-helix (wHTH) protein